MPFRSHLQLLISGIATWAGFWVLGLPDYYQQYSFTFLVVGTVALVPPSAWAGWWIISRTKPEFRASRGLWLSLYFTLPFMMLDSLYCGVYLGNSVGFFTKYWYLTAFYVIPWVLFVPMGFLITSPRTQG